MRTSRWQARHFSGIAAEMRHALSAGASTSIAFPESGPYDRRLGYTALPDYIAKLKQNGFIVQAQARQTARLAESIARGYSPPYREKNAAGLNVLDCRADALYAFTFPQRGYRDFETIPPLVARTLVFIENRQLLASDDPRRNPAIEWPRLAKAVISHGVRLVDRDFGSAGGSTLATQIEKYRHSPSGITTSVGDKFRQMYSASLKAYGSGADTTAARRRILVDYLNTVPLAAAPGYGEVSGLADGLAAWYGADPAAVNAALREGATLEHQGRAYRQVLSLMIAQRRPSWFLLAGREDLTKLTDSHLRVLADAGVITRALRDAAMSAKLTFANDALPAAAEVESWKAAYTARARVSALLGGIGLYDLDRLDLTVKSAFDAQLQERVARTLARLHDREHLAATGRDAARLVGTADPKNVIYSFTLYERTENANRVRVQIDTAGRPFDINEGARIELGSTAKLRTLAHYLQVIADLHARYSAHDARALDSLEVDRRDRLAHWAFAYLSRAEDRRLETMLEAALERRYSANPGERFFTGGGVHRFSNFSSRHNGRSPTVREAFHHSVNLPFVRIMRDIVHHYLYGAEDSPAAVIGDAKHPARAAYLARFADFEGREFLRRFYARYETLTPAQALEKLGANLKAIPRRLAVAYRSVRPHDGIEALTAFLQRHAPAWRLSARTIETLYEDYAIERFSLHDRGYLARTHPLELWLLAWRMANPEGTLEEAIAASAAERQEVYAWLYKRSKSSQDRRIRVLLEIDTFEKIHAHWARLGYPFDALVPSYATALGVSGDNPAALAELTGIILNGGVRYPTVRIEKLHFARDTPYETVLARERTKGQRVMDAAVAAALQDALTGVVERGTARRLRGAYVLPDGTPLVLGGKTGTGDNRHKEYSRGGALVRSRSVSRTATFTFLLGTRHFGVITAYVPAPYAADYRFTSALPVQIVSNMAPQLIPYLASSRQNACSTGAASASALPH